MRASSIANALMLTLAPKISPQNSPELCQLLAKGLALHESGDLAAAQACYGALLHVDPGHAEGVVAQKNQLCSGRAVDPIGDCPKCGQ